MTSPPSFDVIVASALAARIDVLRSRPGGGAACRCPARPLGSKLRQLAFERSGSPALLSEVDRQLMQHGSQAAELRRPHVTERQREILQ
jgi:hypothetical protein